jgi:hypothetical protein
MLLVIYLLLQNVIDITCHGQREHVYDVTSTLRSRRVAGEISSLMASLCVLVFIQLTSSINSHW